MNELIKMLQSYLMGASGLGECAAWLAGVDWDDPDLTDAEKESVGLFELLITEVAEGLRKEREFWEAAAELVADKSQTVYSWRDFPEVSVAEGTATTTNLTLELVVLGGRESRSWNISPQVVPW